MAGYCAKNNESDVAYLMVSGRWCQMTELHVTGAEAEMQI